MPRPALRQLIWALSILFIIVLAANLLPMLRGDVPWLDQPEKFEWWYRTPRWGWFIAGALSLALYLYGALRLLADPMVAAAAYPRPLILWTFVGSALLSLVLISSEGRALFVLFARSTSTVTGGFNYAVSYISNLDDTLRHWPAFIAEYRELTHHRGGVTLSPPGLVAANYGMREAWQTFPTAADQFAAWVRPLQCQNLEMLTWNDAQWASVWVQLFMPLWSALAVAPLYRLGQRIFGSDTARLAIVMWPLVPGFMVFQPRFNVFFPLLALIALGALWRGLQRNRARWIVISGFVTSIGTFFNLSLVPLGLLLGLTITGYHLLPAVQRPRTLTRGQIAAWLRDEFALGIGSASLWVLFWALAGLAPWTIIDTAFEYHTDLDRPYLPWLFLHPYDMFFFMGVPLTFFTLWRWGQLRSGNLRQPAQLFTGAALLALVVMVLSGTARGETGRVWLWLAPVWVLLAADILTRVQGRTRIVFFGLQAACTLVMVGFLDANVTDLTDPPQPAAAQSGPTFTVDARLTQGDDSVTLVGLSLEATSDTVTLQLHWRAETAIEHAYVLTLNSVTPEGEAGPALNWNPQRWEYPPACWTPGREFVDTVPVELGEQAQPGPWLFSVAIVDAYSGEPLEVTLPDGSVSTQIGIGPVTVP